MKDEFYLKEMENKVSALLSAWKRKWANKEQT